MAVRRRRWRWRAERWNFLPNHQAVIDYLVAFKMPDPEQRAEKVAASTQVTKSGVNVWPAAE